MAITAKQIDKSNIGIIDFLGHPIVYIHVHPHAYIGPFV